MIPDIGIPVLSNALIVESVDLGNLPALVVAPQDCYSGWVSDLEADQQ